MALNLTNTIDHQCANDHLYSQNFATVKLRFSPTITILIYSIYLLPFCFGIFGNISVCLIFFQQKKLRSITNTFLMNLCLNDLIVLCVSIPMTLSAALLEHWIFGAFLCKLVNFTPTLTALVSTFTVAIISVERWFFIVNKKKFDRHCTILTLILLWIVSILIALPEFISRHIEEFAPPPISFSMPKINSSSNINNNINNNNNNNDTDLSTMNTIKSSCQMKKVYFCVLNPGLRMRIFSYFVITVQYLVPFLFVSVSCYSISRFLKRRMKQMRVYQTHNRTSSFNNKSLKQEKKTKFQRESSRFDDISEQGCTSYEELPVTIVTNKTKSTNFLTCFRHIFQNHEEHHQTSIILHQGNHSSSSDVNKILMPKVKNQSHSERRFHRSKKLLICVAILFTISWLPLTVVQIYLEHNEEITRNEPNFVYAFLLIPCYLISSLSAWMNPVIYNYINRSFRREFYALYPCCCKLTSLSSPPSVHARTTMPSSVITKRAPIRTLKSIEENTIVTVSRPKRKLGARFITYSDGQTKNASAAVMINEHI
ncbi:unnamed protein product [Rotaria sordida]|uniref:G-protein coupled receptors family 1 profile domain-containing protein n=1 Tax=Rotaria sordida TaxID=392033 RepID=A0A818V7F6_9BILA|nr:unnamed protein product [Rotaria sordida]CAF3704885.1 unnamed protein product [Rotaria sordida]